MVKYFKISTLSSLFIISLLLTCKVFAAAPKPSTSKAPEEQVQVGPILPKEPIVLASDYNCPFACIPNTESEGFLVEVAKKILEKKGIKVIFKLMKRTEAIRAVAEGSVDGILGVSKDEASGVVFPSVSQSFVHTAVFTLADDFWSYDGAPSLKNKIIGTIDGHPYPLEFRTFLYSNYLSTPANFVFSSEKNSIADVVTKLQNKAIEIYVGDEFALNYYINQNNITNIKNCGYVSPLKQNIYIAFSEKKEWAKDLAQILSGGTLDLKISNEYRELTLKYQLPE
ncbi:MAG: transporter substrate-binding domain-containing protein [Rickettsiaceae bacterium]|nr:transporter substrate-binding domain-containing protein [Rickettsiaceae bacterium]